jgi:hypothetical protein
MTEDFEHTIDEGAFDAVWHRADDNERFGMQFGLFPVWVMDYALPKEQMAQLIRRASAAEAARSLKGEACPTCGQEFCLIHETPSDR